MRAGTAIERTRALRWDIWSSRGVCVCLTALISSDENRYNALRVYSACSGTDGARCIVRVICHKARDVRFWDDFVQMERFPQTLTGYQIRYIHCPRLTSVWGG